MGKKSDDIVPVVDIHCHILPGLDDGASDMEETLSMLKIAAEQGITHMICTPHYKAGRKNASPETVEKKLAEVEDMAKKQEIPIKLYPGNEVQYFRELEERVEDGRILSLNRSGYLLVEFLPGDQFRHIKNAVYDVMDLGLTPVVAHVERYECMVKHQEYAAELHELGAEIQINAASVLGETGGKIKKYTRKLLEDGIVDYIATDAHESKKRAPYIRKCKELLYKKYDRQYADAVLYENARRNFLL